MSEDLTKKLQERTSDNLVDVATMVRDLSARVFKLERFLTENSGPGWEKLLAGIAQLQEGQRRLEEKIDELVAETRSGLLDLKRQLSILNDTLLKVREDYKDNEDTFIN
jgi:hypothetical protein